MNKYLILLGGLICCGGLYADPYLVQPDERVDAIISLNQLNRIKVLDDRITQVFGDENTFTLETDTETGQIFIKPKDEKLLFLTIVTENGESIDLALNPTEMDARTLLLQLQTREPLQNTARNKTASLKNQVVSLINAMSAGVEIEGFSRLKAVKEEQLAPFELELKSIYQGEGLVGEIWVIKNTSHQIQHLTEKQFAKDPLVIGIALKTQVLEPNASTQLFKVKTHE